MNKLAYKTFVIIVSMLVLGWTFYYFNDIYGWSESGKNTDTPDQFLNKTVNKKEDYIKDSSIISLELKNLLLKHEDFFYSKEYFEGTEIIIDTIVYSPNLNKLGILILTKNPTSRQLLPIENETWYYNAITYLGIRQSNTISLSPIGTRFVNFTNKRELSDDIREACFKTFASKNTNENYIYKYNLNDIRFWTSIVWQEIEENKIKKTEFEDGKLKHLENVH
jgi:hypothetical protein